MAETLVERVWAWLHETFPERQIYIRSDGRVQFFTFGPALQATLAGLSLIFLGWVAFATVNVIFKDRIIQSKDHRYQQMQAAYENRVADLQLSYDELNGALVSAEDRFTATANELQAKQNTIVKFLDRKREVDRTLASLGNAGAAKGGSVEAAAPMPVTPAEASDSLGVTAPAGLSDQDSDAGGSSEITVMPQPMQPHPGKATKASFLDLDGVVSRLAGVLFGSRPSVRPPVALIQHPALKVLAEQTDRIKRIGATETALMTRTQDQLSQGTAELQTVMRRTGINPDKLLQKQDAAEGVGGPDIPLQSVRIAGLADGAFQAAYLNASALLSRLDELLSAMRHVPLATPVSGPQFERTSGFGARIDPFTGRYSFHPGVDFAGPWGSPVLSTAPGTVVSAGPRGAYGNMVEIDHGFGIHTRYGHLSAILVSVGAKVGKGTPVGRLGSTGRSTGPHVHYEVWYDGELRNPRNFIEAGQHVL